MAKDGQTRRGAIGSLAGALASPYTVATGFVRDQALGYVLPDNRFVGVDLATARGVGEATTFEGTYFIAIGKEEGEAEVRLRTASASDLIYWYPIGATFDSGKVLDKINWQPSGEAGGGSPVVLRRYLEREITTLDVASDGSDVAAILQDRISAAAAETRKGRREVVIRGGGLYGYAAPIVVPDEVRIVVDGDARLCPTADGLTCFRAYGELPSSAAALTADTARGADAIELANNASFAVGDYVWMSSDKLIDSSPNTQELTQAQMLRVVALNGSTGVVFDRVIQYDFLVSDNAKIGVMDCRRDIRFDNVKIGIEGGFRFFRGLDLRYCADGSINDFHAGWNRASPDVDPVFDVPAANAIGLRHCSSFEINRYRGDQLAHYLLEINGASHNVTARGGEAHRVRHGVALNWSDNGEPVDVLIDDLRTSITTHAGADTHDVGRDITFRKIRCEGSLSMGMQIRTSNVLVEDYVGRFNGTFGLAVRADSGEGQLALENVRLRDIAVTDNGARGINSECAIDLDGARVLRNGSDLIPKIYEKGGVFCPSGRIANADIRDNNGPAIVYMGFNVNSDNFGPLTIRDVTAPKSNDQSVFMWSSVTFADRGLKLRDVRAPGYASDNLFQRSGSTVIAGIDHAGCDWGTGEREGAVTLAAGTATVVTDQVRESHVNAGLFKSFIELMRQSLGANPGELSVSISDGEGFTITSSSASDDSVVRWRIV